MSSWLGLKEVAAADVSTPPAGKVRFFLDSADNVPKFKDSSGTVTPITSADPELAAIAALVSAANKGIMFTGSGTATTFDLSAAALTVLDDASVAAMVNTLGGASSTGSGGLVRETAPTLSSPVVGTQSPGDNSTKAASTAYADAAVAAAVAGLSWKQAVRVATTAALTLASDFENGDTVDGVVLATGDRILIKNQASAAENGIYTVNASGAPTRATDANSGSELVNASCYVSEGTTNADTQWTCTTNAPITVGVTSLAFAQITTSGTPGAHATSHQNGGSDEISVTGLSGTLADAQPVAVHKNGTLVGTRKNINLIEGSNVTLTIADDSGDDEVDVTIASTASGGGGLVLLEQHTASNSASLDFTAFISSTYDEYRFEFVNIIPATNNVAFNLLVGTGGGPSYDSTGTNYSSQISGIRNDGIGVTAVQNPGTPQLAAGLNSTASFNGYSGDLTLYDPQSTAGRRNFVGNVTYVNATPNVVRAGIGVQYTNNGTALTAVRFVMSSGNIASGTIRVYGVAK